MTDRSRTGPPVGDGEKRPVGAADGRGALTTTRWVVGVAFGLLSTTGLVLWLGRVGSDFDVAMENLPSFLPTFAFGIVGLIVLRLRPRHVVGWAFAAFGLVLAVRGVGTGLAAWDVDASWVEAFTAVPVFPGLMALGVLMFPNGRLPSPRWRWLLWLIVASFPVDVLLAIFGRDLGSVALAVVLVPAVVSLGFRRRAATPVESQQLRWLFTATLAFVGEVILGITLDALGESGGSSFDWVGDFIFMGLAMSIPLAMGLAITRYKLFDLDRIVSRTVSYAVVLAVLAVGYAGLVLALRSLLPVEGPLPVALSTLAVAFAFFPLVRRIQAFVDRRFFRSRYDAASVVAAFASELRSTVDPGTLVGRTETVVEDTFHAESVSVWLAEEPA